MADRIEVFDVTVPAGTAVAAPATTALEFADGIVTDIEILIPPGPSGFVGFRFAYGGQQIIPHTVNEFIIASGEVIKWPISHFPTGTQWQLQAHNTDIYDHTIHIRFLVTELAMPTRRLPDPVPIPIPGDETLQPSGVALEDRAFPPPLEF